MAKKMFKYVGVVLLALALIVLNPIIWLVGTVVFNNIIAPVTVEMSTNIEDYDKYLSETRHASDLLPTDFNELGEYEGIEFGYKKVLHELLLGFESEGIALFVKYGDNYEAEKERVLNKYTYLEDNSDSYIESQFPLTCYDYGGYEMRIVPDWAYSQKYDCRICCQEFLTIGTNDKEKTIAYLFYYDSDIAICYPFFT